MRGRLYDLTTKMSEARPPTVVFLRYFQTTYSIYYRRVYLLSSLSGLFDTGAGRIVLWVTHAYAREHMI